MHVVVGLDLATFKTGFAVGDKLTRKVSRFGKIEIPTTEFMAVADPRQMDRLRAKALVSRVLRFIIDAKPQRVLIEDTRIRFGNREQDLQEYYKHKNMGIVEWFCDEKKIEVIWVPIQSWKSALYPKGWQKLKKAKAFDDKKESVKIIRSLYGIDVESDDSAEAVALLHYDFKRG
jgi:hypothetical protein